MRNKKIKLFIEEIVMLLVCIVFVIPLYYLVVSSVKTNMEIATSPLSLSLPLNVENYKEAFLAMDFFRSLGNSVFVTAIADFLIVLFSSMAAYTLARKRDTKIVKFSNWYLLLGFMVPVHTTMLPLFRIMSKIHLLNSLWGLIFLQCNGCVFGTILYRGFIKALPEDLEEAGRIDGAGTFKIFWKIVFPLLKPVTVTLVIFDTMAIWNDFIYNYLFLNSPSKTSLVMKVYYGMHKYELDWSIMMPTLVIALLPMVIFYLVLQKHIIGGLTMGSLKF